MKIVIKNVNEKAKIVEVEYSLEIFQSIVGGYIEVFPFQDNILMVLNEEGKINDLPLNFILANENYEEQIVGNVFFTSRNDVDFDSLNEEQIEILKDMGIFDLE